MDDAQNKNQFLNGQTIKTKIVREIEEEGEEEAEEEEELDRLALNRSTIAVRARNDRPSSCCGVYQILAANRGNN